MLFFRLPPGFDRATLRLAARTILISAAIISAAMLADYVLNVWVIPGPHNPLSTLAGVLLIAPPVVLALLQQTEKVRRAERDLTQEHAARLSAEAVSAARSRFLANMSHQLRTPLNGMIGFSEMMQETAELENREQDAADHKRVIDGAKRLSMLLNDLLDLAKIEAGRMQLAFAPYDIRAMLTAAIDSVNPIVERNRNQIVLHVEEGLSDGCSDVSRLGQCVLNLLSNAAKFTSDGLITVVARRSLEQDVEHLLIIVEDTGVGIATDKQALLFEPFMQTDGSGVTASGGAGLGLAMTRQLARLMCGEVSVQSESARGACFTLRVPLHAVAEEQWNSCKSHEFATAA